MLRCRQVYCSKAGASAMRKVILFVLSIAMVAAGLYVLAAQTFWSPVVYGWFVLMGAFLTWAGTYLLSADFVEPILGRWRLAVWGLLAAIAVVAIVGWLLIAYPMSWVVIVAGALAAVVGWYGVVLNLRAVLRLMRQRPERRGDEGA
jgi:hypothetical protein